MKCTRPQAFLLMLALLAVSVPPAVFAGDIFKWTDANGVVHYGDRPNGAGTEQVVTISSKPTDPAKVQARAESRAAARDALTGDDEAGAESAEKSEEQLAEERARKCTMYKERLQKFVTSRRLYREDENGERVYLDEEETLAARAKVQEKVVEFCNS